MANHTTKKRWWLYTITTTVFSLLAGYYFGVVPEIIARYHQFETRHNLSNWRQSYQNNLESMAAKIEKAKDELNQRQQSIRHWQEIKAKIAADIEQADAALVQFIQASDQGQGKDLQFRGYLIPADRVEEAKRQWVIEIYTMKKRLEALESNLAKMEDKQRQNRQKIADSNSRKWEMQLRGEIEMLKQETKTEQPIQLDVEPEVQYSEKMIAKLQRPQLKQPKSLTSSIFNLTGSTKTDTNNGLPSINQLIAPPTPKPQRRHPLVDKLLEPYYKKARGK